MKNSGNPEFVPVNRAQKILKNLRLSPPDIEKIPVSKSVGRIAASDITAARDIPRFDNSAMDGYLFHKDDIDNGKRVFPLAGEIRPEDHKPDSLKPGVAVRIMTGAPIPEGEYIVVPVETAQESRDEVTVHSLPSRNPIRKQGEGYQTGRIVLEKGSLIRPYEMGLLIESGNRMVQVLKPLRIAVQVTGSEIDEDTDSNGPVLHSIISSWPGVQAERIPVLDDDPAEVTARMKQLGNDYDMVITTGGISAGKHDYILKSMTELGADVLIRKVQQKPGKPFTVTRLDGVPFFHLPGNPVSAVFTAEYYVRQTVLRSLGLKPHTATARLAAPASNKRPGKSLFLTGRLFFDSEHRLTVSAQDSMRSHLMQLYRDQHAYVRLDPETEYSTGDRVEVTPFFNAILSPHL